MLSLPPTYAQALRDLPDTADNAFYWREKRRDARRGEPWRSMADTTVALGFVLMAALLAVWGITILAQGFPDELGGRDPWRFVFAAVLWVHCLQVYFACRWRTARILSDEARGGTLVQVLATRVPAFELLAQAMVYPFQHAVLVALAGLPLYLMFLGRGTIRVPELLATYTLLLGLAVAPPAWRTPAFAEYSPEEMAAAAQSQERNAGCATAVLALAFIPGAMFVGGVALGLHMLAVSQRWSVTGAWVPAELWRMLPAAPLVGPWILVRLLAVPVSWFGLPIAPWLWALPLILLSRLSALWLSSLFLRVSHPTQVWELPDTRAMYAWRRSVVLLRTVAFAGYFWQPLLAANLFGRLTAQGPVVAGDNLSGAIIVATAIGLAFALHRVRRRTITPYRRAEDRRRAWAWLSRPLLPAGIVTLVALVTAPRAFATLAVWQVLAPMVAVAAAWLVLAGALGRGTTWVWRGMLIAGVVAPLVPLRWFSVVGALNPIVALAGLSPGLAAAFGTGAVAYHLPPWWASIGVPLALVGPALWAARSGALERFARTETVSPARVLKLQRTASASPQVWLPQQPSSPDGATPPRPGSQNAVPTSPPAREPSGPLAMPQAGAAPPVVSVPPVAAPPVIVARPALQPPVAPVVVTIPAPMPAPSADRAWRFRPLSPWAAAVLRWLVRRTDNPVVLYSARRELPGSLGTESVILGGIALAFGVFLAWAWPEPYTWFGGAFGLFYGLFPGALSAQAEGYSGLLTWMVLVSLFASLRVCRRVAAAYRRERESSTLGFVLATPLPSLSVAAGYAAGPALPALVMWAAIALSGLVPAAAAAATGSPLQAAWGWAFGFFISLLYLVFSAVTGAWIGITEAKARDVTVGVWILPPAFLTIALGAAVEASLNLHFAYPACVVLFVGSSLLMLAWLWRSTVKELMRIRHGDLPFEGRTVQG